MSFLRENIPDGLEPLLEYFDSTYEGMSFLRENIPDGLEPLLEYFDSTYVSGTYRQIQPPQRSDGTLPPLRMRRKPPTFPPSIWNVLAITIEGGSRTNNICEGWNNAFSKLVGHSHPTIWRAIDTIRKDQAQAATIMQREKQGEPPSKRTRRHTVQLQNRLHTFCTAIRDGKKSVPETLLGVGLCVRFK